MIELLETENWKTFGYYHHTEHPLIIDVEFKNGLIHCNITKLYKMSVSRELSKKSVVLGRMTRE